MHHAIFIALMQSGRRITTALGPAQGNSTNVTHTFVDPHAPMPLPPRLLELKRALREKWLYVHPAGTSEPAPLLTRTEPPQV